MASCTALNKLGANKWGDLAHVAGDLKTYLTVCSVLVSMELGTLELGTLESGVLAQLAN